MFHKTPDGPKPCDATEKACKYGPVSNHYKTEREAFDAMEREAMPKNVTLTISRDNLANRREKIRNIAKRYSPGKNSSNRAIYASLLVGV